MPIFGNSKRPYSFLYNLNRLLGLFALFGLMAPVIGYSQIATDSPPITFTGSTVISGQHSNLAPPGSQVSNEFLRYQLNATLGVYGMPINAQLYLTTEPTVGRASQQRFSISANPAMLYNRIPILSWFNDISIGRTSPTYSKFTLQGTRVDGFSSQINPGSIYVAFVTGLTQRKSSEPGFGRAGFNQYIIGGSLGYGDPSEGHLHLTYIRIKDDAESLAEAVRPTGITPSENHVFGLKGGLQVWERKITLNGEIAGALITHDTEQASVTGLEVIPGWMENFFNPNLSTTYDYAWNLNSRIQLPTTRITAGAEWVGPGYRTLGNLWLRNDVFQWHGRIDQFFNNRRININAHTRQNRDNLIPWKMGTTFTRSYGFGAGLRYPGYPSIQVNFSPSFRENNERGIDIDTWLISVTSAYTHRFGNHQSTTSLFVSYQQNDTHNPQLDYARYMVSLNEILTLNRRLTLRGSHTWNQIRFESLTSTFNTTELGINWRKDNTLSLNGGGRISNQSDYGSRFGFYAGLDVSVGVIGVLSVKAEQSFFRDDFEGLRDFDQSVVKGSLTKRW